MVKVSQEGPIHLESQKAWIVWGVSTLFYCYQFLLRVAPSVLTDVWMASFGIEAGTLGIIAAFYYVTYAGMQIPFGVMMDRIGPRRLLTGASVVCSLGCLLIAKSQTASQASIGRLLIGLGGGCGFLGTMKLATLWFTSHTLGFISSMTTGLGTIGAIIGAPFLTMLNQHIGWRASMGVLAMIGVGISILLAFLVRDTPKTIAVAPKAPEDPLPLLQGMKKLFSNPLSWKIALYAALMYVPLSAFADLWGVSYLQCLYGIDKKTASIINGMIFVGIVAGGPVFAYLSEKCNSRRIPMGIGAIGSCLLYGLIIYVDGISPRLMAGLFFLAGFFFPSQCLSFAAACEIMPQKISGVTVGFTNMMVMLSGIVFQPLIGWCLEVFGTSFILNIEPMYSLLDYRYALWSIPLALLGAALVVTLLQETYPSANKAA